MIIFTNTINAVIYLAIVIIITMIIIIINIILKYCTCKKRDLCERNQQNFFSKSCTYFEMLPLIISAALEDHVANLDVFKCPQGHDVTKLCDKLAQNSVTLFTVLEKVVKPGTCSSPSHQVVEAFYSGMSLRTGGQLISTQNAKLISPVRAAFILN